MEHNLDHIFNQIPQKSVYFYQAVKSNNEPVLGVALCKEGRKDVEKLYQGKILKILLLKLPEQGYNNIVNIIINLDDQDLGLEIEHLLSNSSNTIHMN